MALGKNLMFVAILLFLNFGTAAAITDPQICYILDGILFLYGIILSALYCRIKILNAKVAKAEKLKAKADERIYMGLAPHEQSTYETIGQKK
ncbi:high affinity immunoglobulin epsilon receptor subunit gamma [Takifugu rubripes]|uniref:High affinity immunoglobulin epsilon receptor subunit gamma n=1 Tax=Takifugu bimaculatus TaxID=433685 RepID=A0A4Z2BN88_9TELE|nr:high affinity immunoglobulin epsilon receptor subunit gamma [Takifugu rubripes]XP_011604848.1 high affinity immunoglobulin epsilon receptor subunit gamma [Takifugu rubripes]XP_056883653.1 high affinity immunoglobulin epsilon receptor subunit gamma [Takifugu flavidus]TNM93499.1 hypothetical protein fugu_001675 [Takifugu bimaculatus]|eukprot:XP_003966836.1 PREDICTED: high affinity immunoglobulin epsilon receptor subunit gamma [Takifugu rubripes]